MSTNSKKPILWSLVFALAMIASAFLFKGNPALYWIEAGFMVAALTFVVLKPQRVQIQILLQPRTKNFASQPICQRAIISV